MTKDWYEVWKKFSKWCPRHFSILMELLELCLPRRLKSLAKPHHRPPHDLPHAADDVRAAPEDALGRLKTCEANGPSTLCGWVPRGFSWAAWEIEERSV